MLMKKERNMSSKEIIERIEKLTERTKQLRESIDKK